MLCGIASWQIDETRIACQGHRIDQGLVPNVREKFRFLSMACRLRRTAENALEHARGIAAILLKRAAISRFGNFR